MESSMLSRKASGWKFLKCLLIIMWSKRLHQITRSHHIFTLLKEILWRYPMTVHLSFNVHIMLWLDQPLRALCRGGIKFSYPLKNWKLELLRQCIRHIITNLDKIITYEEFLVMDDGSRDLFFIIAMKDN